jgi:hypothetical protein
MLHSFLSMTEYTVFAARNILPPKLMRRRQAVMSKVPKSINHLSRRWHSQQFLPTLTPPYQILLHDHEHYRLA